jgi:hypothetical protein
MGVAIGFALSQPPIEALAVFEALGLGLALPFLALSLVPAWRRFLPQARALDGSDCGRRWRCPSTPPSPGSCGS